MKKLQRHEQGFHHPAVMYSPTSKHSDVLTPHFLDRAAARQRDHLSYSIQQRLRQTHFDFLLLSEFFEQAAVYLVRRRRPSSPAVRLCLAGCDVQER